MRRSCLLLALVASATAGGNARSGRLVEKDVNLNPRGLAETSRSLDARLVPVDAGRVGKVMLRSRRTKRDDDDNDKYEDWEDEYKDRFEEMQGQNVPAPPGSPLDHHDDDDDDDDDDNDGPSGGVIAGSVIGGLLGLLLILTIWYCLRIRPKRKQRQMEAAMKQDELEKGFGGSSPSIHPPPPAMAGVAPVSPNSESPSPHHIQWAPTPFPGRAPSVQTGSSISGLALPTPALTYSPSITTGTTNTAAGTPNLPPSHLHALPGDKPPAYAAVLALQSSEPQPEASAYQMGQVPIPAEPPVYQLPSAPQTGATDMKGEPISRY
ncbi:hypothetical protein F4820DRAFT_177073 [Hypoxylon rubiginosum]|uniref:Uncharacterized protein n=1 Tax=Hypoxylon rubiginosum TaxID=110542 RepID=A0ACB9YJM4_9PEZI|nr:hypothetical protein F4820DRAFT_177073 [Hypoxylon rubiginosum]